MKNEKNLFCQDFTLFTFLKKCFLFFFDKVKKKECVSFLNELFGEETPNKKEKSPVLKIKFDHGNPLF
jgi:hypothetical protein